LEVKGGRKGKGRLKGGIYREDQGSSGWEKRWRVRVKGGRKGECQV
jgi:hypothetical protein